MSRSARGKEYTFLFVYRDLDVHGAHLFPDGLEMIVPQAGGARQDETHGSEPEKERSSPFESGPARPRDASALGIVNAWAVALRGEVRGNVAANTSGLLCILRRDYADRSSGQTDCPESSPCCFQHGLLSK